MAHWIVLEGHSTGFTIHLEVSYYAEGGRREREREREWGVGVEGRQEVIVQGSLSTLK